MLRLRRLEISGFKSFVDPVSTEFAPGITAIVGPNGCGKSNLAEALTWALGEQSAKFLRGQRMEDVIFSGSQGRRPLGMAEVSLKLDADPALETAIDGEIEIHRRVFRTGESQYRLNGKVVALHQIRDLLMDTGLGIRAYSVIGQGQVETIVSGKPQERRKLLEEAAGITRYKARKRVAEIKLEEAVGNLERLDDVISEIDRSLRSLKRQANAARRYRESEEAFEGLLSTVLFAKWDRAQAELAAKQDLLTRLRAEDAELGAALSHEEAALASGREAAEALVEGLSTTHARQAELLARIEGRQEFLRGSRQAIEEAVERSRRGEELAQRLEHEIATLTGALEASSSRHHELESELGSAREAVALDVQELERAREALATAKARLETVRAEILASNAEVASHQARLHEERIEAEKSSYRKDHNLAEIARLAQQHATADRILSQASLQTADLEGRIEETQAELEQASAGLQSTLDEEAAALEQRDMLRTEATRLGQRSRFLDELEEEERERRSTVCTALAGAGIDEPAFLADSLRVPPEWEHSIDLYLEAVRDAVLVPRDEDPMTLASLMSAAGARGTLLQAGSDDIRVSRVPADSAIRQSLSTALGLPEEYATSLPPAFLVDSGADAERLARLNPGIAFLSRDRLYAHGGLIRIQGEEARPGTFARRREIVEISRELPRTEEALRNVGHRLETLIGTRTLQAEHSHQVEQTLHGLRRELAVATARHDEALARREELDGARRGLEETQGRIVDEIEATATRREKLQALLTNSLSRHGELEESFDASEQELATARERRELLSTAGAGRRGKLDLLSERLDAHRVEAERVEGQISDLRHQSHAWEDEAGALEARRIDLAAGIREADSELQAALEGRDEGAVAVRRAEEELGTKRQELRDREERVEGARAEREDRRGRIEDVRVDEAALGQEASHLDDSYTERFGEPIREALADREADTPELAEEQAAEPGTIDQLELRLEEHRQALDRHGPVNLLAADEYAEQEERHRFLTEQRADVQGSIDTLRKTIRDINETSSERFRETFEKVNEHFAAVFQELFRGGEAEMRLLDENDILESGIEIVARPPGKKLQNITLLSGGEKALTAVALLFGLFRTKPSPFCILDEVDAPLDDANVLRFVELLRRYSLDIQFLIISHNKLTMEVASTLYGVTMEEKGVSKLVAVELDEIHPPSEQVSA
ncbi:MAG: chromosome segregation protein SMC [Acidobacteriota bacterium]|nr:chromosome segregation protein SMC [Acidobacteriota bacterium]